MAQKEGLESALDFTKFVIAMDGALIAFVTGAAFLQDITSPLERGAALVALVALAVSIAAGILVAMETATKLSKGQYGLADKWIKIPGAVNVIAFAIGAVAVASLAAFELFLESPSPASRTQSFEGRCTDSAGTSQRSIECSGTIDSAR